MKKLLTIKNILLASIKKGFHYLKNHLFRPRIFRDTFVVYDSSYVRSGFTSEIEQDQEIRAARKWDKSKRQYQWKVSLISAIKNEAEDIEEWFDRMQKQTRLPDEIIIIDGGSTDGTLAELEKYSKISSIPIRIIIDPDGNIAKNRNRAITEAQFQIIAVTDFGCFPKTDWLENIILPFEMDPDIVVSAGIYQPIWKGNSFFQKQTKIWSWSTPDSINPDDYLPPGGSIAVIKEAWRTVGGYPEWLTLSGEDTYFDLQLKFLGGKWAFVPNAVVEWSAPDSFRSYFRKLFYWAIGDGESGIHAREYWKYCIQLLALLLTSVLSIVFIVGFWGKSVFIWFVIFCGGFLLVSLAFSFAKNLTLPLLFLRIFGEIAQILGFIKGARSRVEVQKRREASINGTIFLLAGVPLDDTGGGSRAAQIAKEFLRQNYAVVYIYKYPKNESRELNIHFCHPNLIVNDLSHFQWNKFVSDHRGLIKEKNVMGIVEFPMRDFLPIVENIKNEKGKILYDLVDDWRTSLGGNWYTPQDEMEFVNESDFLSATAQPLRDHLIQMSGRQVELIPNAVDDRIFNDKRTYPCPPDLLLTEGRIIIYVGALWGEWFDWELLEKVAQANKESLLYIIGDYRGQYKNTLPNIKFLGLKRQIDLPAYLAFSDVAIIPWKLSRITQATSPLKVFEFLAMNCPVVAPDLQPLRGIPGLFLSKDHNDFIEFTEKINRSMINKQEIMDFIEHNNWNTRVKQIHNLLRTR